MITLSMRSTLVSTGEVQVGNLLLRTRREADLVAAVHVRRAGRYRFEVVGSDEIPDPAKVPPEGLPVFAPGSRGALIEAGEASMREENAFVERCLECARLRHQSWTSGRMDGPRKTMADRKRRELVEWLSEEMV